MGRKSKAKKARRAQGAGGSARESAAEAAKTGESEGPAKAGAAAGADPRDPRDPRDPKVTVSVRGPGEATAPDLRPSQRARKTATTVSVSGPAEFEDERRAPQPTKAASRPASGGTPREAASRAPSGAAPPPGGAASGGGGTPASASGTVGKLHAMLGALGVGVAIALYLVRHKLKISLDPDYVSSCNYGGAVNCDAVNISQWSEILGIPISLLALPTYFVMAYLVWLAIGGRAVGATRPVRERGDVSLKAVASIGLLTVAYSLYLAFVSTAWVRAYCVYCIGLYLVNIVVTALAFAAGAGSPVTAVRDAVRALLGFRTPVPAAIGLVVVTMALALGGYSTAKGSMEEAYKRRIDAQLAEDLEVAATPASPARSAPDAVTAKLSAADAPTRVASATPAAPAAPAAPADSAARGPVNLQSTDRGVRGGKKTEDGWTYFEPPLDDESEFWHGPKDAKVTVVKYADFECAYCRRLADSFEKIHAKYGERVRFVMKHFPMNIKCNASMRGFDKHPVACEAAYTAHCAGEQGKFWEMHDLLYDNQPSLALESLPGYAEQLGLDMIAFDACYESPATAESIRRDVEAGLYAGIYGTPRTYINNRLVTGSANEAILEYYIDKAFEAVEGAGVAEREVVVAPRPDGTSMVEARTEAGAFFIDAYEAAITIEGKAVSQPGVEPAHADYFTATAACEKAGKRLCTEEEWVSACTGVPAIDNNGNKMFADDTVEGDMYPYGPYHEEGYCNDRADNRTGEAEPAGSNEQCRTPAGVFDLAGNIAEWADAANDKPTLLGGTMSSATGAACNRRTFSTPAGSRNRTTGFRCCADANVRSEPVELSMIQPNLTSVVDMPVPNFATADVEGNEVDSTEFRGQVTLVNFFASWCGPCKKEFPHLVDYADRYKDRGFSIVGVGVDTLPTRSVDFAKGFDVNFPIVTDPEAQLKGKFLVYEMPATFLVDREGVVRYSATGFSGDDQEAELRSAIEKLL